MEFIRKGREYKIQAINTLDITRNYPSIIEDFLKDLAIFTDQKLFIEVSTFKTFDRRDVEGKLYPQTNFHYGIKNSSFKRYKDYLYIGLCNHPDAEFSFHIGDTGFPFKGDYLFWLSFYQFTRKLMGLGGKDIELKGFFAHDEFARVIANNDEDIATYFDTQLIPELNTDLYTGDTFFGIWGVGKTEWAKNGRDFIPYLQKSYKIARKMEGFPKDWII